MMMEATSVTGTGARTDGLTFPLIASIGEDVIREAIDPETMAQIIGPGGTEDDLFSLYRGEEEGRAMHAIVEDGRLCGTITFTELPLSNIGFWVRREDRRRGLVRAAWEALSPDYGPAFSAECWAYNAAARGLLESLGFAKLYEHQEPEGLLIGYRKGDLRKLVQDRLAQMLGTVERTA